MLLSFRCLNLMPVLLFISSIVLLLIYVYLLQKILKSVDGDVQLLKSDMLSIRKEVRVLSKQIGEAMFSVSLMEEGNRSYEAEHSSSLPDAKVMRSIDNEQFLDNTADEQEGSNDDAHEEHQEDGCCQKDQEICHIENGPTAEVQPNQVDVATPSSPVSKTKRTTKKTLTNENK